MKARPGFDPASLVCGPDGHRLGLAAAARSLDVIELRLRQPLAGRCSRRRRRPAARSAWRARRRGPPWAAVAASRPEGRTRATSRAAAAATPRHAVIAGVCAGIAPARDRPDRVRIAFIAASVAGGWGSCSTCWLGLLPAGRASPPGASRRSGCRGGRHGRARASGLLRPRRAAAARGHGACGSATRRVAVRAGRGRRRADLAPVAAAPSATPSRRPPARARAPAAGAGSTRGAALRLAAAVARPRRRSASRS